MSKLPKYPTSVERQWLVKEMAQLIELHGADPFLSALVIDDSRKYFPDAWKREPSGIQCVARRLLWHANIRDVKAKVIDLRERIEQHSNLLEETHIEFTKVEPEAVEFELEYIGNDDIIGLLSHEVGIAFREYHQVKQHPFRDTEQSNHVESEDKLAMLGSLTSVYLGFGLLATNASYQVRHGGEFSASSPAQFTTETDHLTVGGLAPEAMSFLCALHAVIRNDAGVYKRLKSNQKTNFQNWFRALKPQREELMQILEINTESEWTEQQVNEIAPFSDEVYEGKSEAELSRFNKGTPVFRVRKNRLIAYVTSIFSVFGSRSKFFYSCSDQRCREGQTLDMTECPRCGGQIVGNIRHSSERLEAEEEWYKNQS